MIQTVLAMAKRTTLVCVSTLLAATITPTPARGSNLIYSDDMSSSVGWQFSHHGGTAKPDLLAGDTTEADFGYDYSALGIPEAPNTRGSDLPTRGLRLAANTTSFLFQDAVAAVYEDVRFTGRYTVQVDIWLNWAANNGPALGTTEHGSVLAGFDIVEDQNRRFQGRSGAGIKISTDGGATSRLDYILNKNDRDLNTFSGQYSVTEYLTGDPPSLSGNKRGITEDAVNVDPQLGGLIDMPALFPSFDIATATNKRNSSGTQPAGAAGFQWVTITAEIDTNAIGIGINDFPGTAKFTVENPASGESVIIGTVDNSNPGHPGLAEQPANMSGAVGLAWIDFFGGKPDQPQFSFGVFDNLRVFIVPEPATFFLMSFGTLLVILRHTNSCR